MGQTRRFKPEYSGTQHARTETTHLDDRREEQVALDEVERIGI